MIEVVHNKDNFIEWTGMPLEALQPVATVKTKCFFTQDCQFHLPNLHVYLKTFIIMVAYSSMTIHLLQMLLKPLNEMLFPNKYF